MNGRPTLAWAVVLPLVCLLLAACGGQEQDAERKADTRPGADPSTAASVVAATGGSPSPTASPSPERSVAPAAAAGGLCRKLDYSRVASALSVRFEVAAASGQAGGEQVCVLLRVGSGVPDLTLSRLPIAPADEPDTDASSDPAADPMTEVEAFRADYQPANAKNVSALGKAGYSRVVAASAGGGPQVEVGWLGTDVIYILTYTTARSTTPAAAAQQVPRLVGLARQLKP